MELVHQSRIKNARIYFFKRLLAWVCTKSPVLLKPWELFGRAKMGMPLNDVEAVYSHLSVDREAENIAIINAVYAGRGNVFYDVGSNYTQFSYGVRKVFSEVHCYDANPEVLRLGKMHFPAENISYHNSAIIPCSESSTSAYFVLNSRNTGISEVIFDNTRDESRPESAINLECRSIADILRNGGGVDDLVKVDVEGLEACLISDLLNETSYKGVFCFESLTRASRKEFEAIFSQREYDFYVGKYDFSDYSGRMARSFLSLIRVIFTGAASVVIYKSESIDGFDFDFIPLIFCVPRGFSNQFLQDAKEIECLL